MLANFPAEHDDILLALTGKTREYFAERLVKCERYVHGVQNIYGCRQLSSRAFTATVVLRIMWVIYSGCRAKQMAEVSTFEKEDDDRKKACRTIPNAAKIVF